MLRLKIPPPVYALLLAGLMWLLNHYLPLYRWLESPWNLAGLILIGGAVSLDFWSLGLFFRARTTPNPMHPERASHLVTTGMYRISRNPMYLGLLVILCGWWIYLGSLTPLLCLPLFVWVLTVEQILPEEAVLEQRFGDAYRDYKRRVRRWI